MPWPEHLTQDAEDTSKYGSDASASSEWLERGTLGDTFDDIPPFAFGQLAEDFIQTNNPGLPNEPPLLDHPVVFPVIDRRFPKVDETLEKLAASMRADRGPPVFDKDSPGDLEDDPSSSDAPATEPTFPEAGLALEQPAPYPDPRAFDTGTLGDPGDVPSSSDAAATGPTVSYGAIEGTTNEETSTKQPTTSGRGAFPSPIVVPASLKQGLEGTANEETISDLNEPAASNLDAFRPPTLLQGSKDIKFQRIDDTTSSNSVIAARGQIGKARVECNFLLKKSQWGFLRPNKTPSAIFFLDLHIHAPSNAWLQSCSISMALSDHLDENAPPDGRRSRPGFTYFFGPKSLVSHANATRSSGSRSRGQSSRPRLSSYITSTASNTWFDKMVWSIEYDNPDDQPTRSEVYHLAFAIEHSAQDFYLKTKVTGTFSSRRINVKRILKFDSKNAETITKFEFRNGYNTSQHLDQLAASLERAMEMENMASTPIEIPEPSGSANLYAAQDPLSSTDSLFAPDYRDPITAGVITDENKEAIRPAEDEEEKAKLAARIETAFTHPTEPLFEQGRQQPSTPQIVPTNEEDTKPMPTLALSRKPGLAGPTAPALPAMRPPPPPPNFDFHSRPLESRFGGSAQPQSATDFRASRALEYDDYEQSIEKSLARPPSTTLKVEEERKPMRPPPHRPTSSRPTAPSRAPVVVHHPPPPPNADFYRARLESRSGGSGRPQYAMGVREVKFRRPEHGNYYDHEPLTEESLARQSKNKEDGWAMPPLPPPNADHFARPLESRFESSGRPQSAMGVRAVKFRRPEHGNYYDNEPLAEKRWARHSKSEEDGWAMPPLPPPYPEHPSRYLDHDGYEPSAERSLAQRPPTTRKASPDEEDRGVMPPPPRRRPTTLAFYPPPSTPARRSVDVDGQDPDDDDPLFRDLPPLTPLSGSYDYASPMAYETWPNSRADLGYYVPNYQTEVAGQTLRRQTSTPPMTAYNAKMDLARHQEYAPNSRVQRDTGKMTTDTPGDMPPPEPRRNEVMFCHACSHQWDRDGHRYPMCPNPNCLSSFTGVLSAEDSERWRQARSEGHGSQTESATDKMTTGKPAKELTKGKRPVKPVMTAAGAAREVSELETMQAERDALEALKEPSSNVERMWHCVWIH
jgi:hypothetical protein